MNLHATQDISNDNDICNNCPWSDILAAVKKTSAISYEVKKYFQWYFFRSHSKGHKITLAVHVLEEHVRASLIFAIIISFMLFTVFTLVYVLYFEEFLIHDSRGFMILKNN